MHAFRPGCPVCIVKLLLRIRCFRQIKIDDVKKGTGSPYSITERKVPELIPVLGSQPAGDVNHKPGGRLSLLSARPVSSYPRNRKTAATNFAAW